MSETLGIYSFLGREYYSLQDVHDELVIFHLSDGGKRHKVAIRATLTSKSTESLATELFGYWASELPWLSMDELTESLEAAKSDVAGFMGWASEKDIHVPVIPKPDDKPKRGRPRSHPLLLKTPRYIKLPEWLWRWIDSHNKEGKKRPEIIEKAMMEYYGIKPPNVKADP